MKASELTKLAKKNGCRIKRHGSEHDIWINPQTGRTAQIPRHPIDIGADGEAFTSVIAVDTETYRRFHENKPVKKALTILMWLNAQAERANVNFSQTLQKAPKDGLNIAR